MKIPVIDFSSYDEANDESITSLGEKVSEALTNIGFMAVTNIGIDDVLLDKVFKSSKDFFAKKNTEKEDFAYKAAGDNFGYHGMLKEKLDPLKPADLKETFTMRTPFKYSLNDARWPSPEFRDTNISFYHDTVTCSNKILTVMASALNLEANYFVRCFNHENISLRLLHYPSVGPEANEAQLGAGSHTDYGIITLLFQDKVGGLEVKDKEGIWHAVDYVENAIIINTGDLMERWTNGKFKSTFHRVQPKIGQQERFSIALFMDPDSATNVEVIESCTSDSNPAKYPPIKAGEHIQAKLLATHM